MNPPKSLLDPAFRYTPSDKTDLRKTFARYRREERERLAEAAKSKPKAAVTDIKRRVKP